MRENKNTGRPYRTLGWYLKFAREQLKRTVPEVSGAVEIEIEDLERFENGESRPSEEILALLISHLELEEPEADSLWELAGYSQETFESPNDNKQQIAIVLPMDPRIVYTDKAHVSVNKSGVVLSFMQTTGAGNQPLAVARVGMSKEQAHKVLSVLKSALEENEFAAKPKLLNAPRQTSHKNKDKK